MKIRLEIPRAQELPSQGRNSGSIPDGGATRFRGLAFLYGDEGINLCALRPRGFYRAWLDADKPDGEFVFFVGWVASNNQLVFEDGLGDLHAFKPDEVEVV